MNEKVRIFLMAESVLFFGAGMLVPIYAVFVEGIGGDVLTAGYSWAVFMFLSGLGFLATGKLIDRTGKEKPFIMAGYALQAAGFMCYMFVSAPMQLFAVQAILGLSAALSFPSREVWFMKSLDKGTTGFQWGMWEAVYAFSAAAASVAGAAIVSAYGFKVLFFAMFIVTLCALAMVARIPGGKK